MAPSTTAGAGYLESGPGWACLTGCLPPGATRFRRRAARILVLRGGRLITIISFVTVAELRFGAKVAGWGVKRLQRLDNELARAETVWPGPELVEKYADGETQLLAALAGSSTWKKVATPAAAAALGPGRRLSAA